MTAKLFFDSNIFLYAGSKAEEDQGKGEVCRTLLNSEKAVISTQVLQEFISNALRKPKLHITEDKIDLMLRMAEEMEVVPVTHALIFEATVIRRRYQVSHWDSTIIAAALHANCEVLYSEDLSHGQKFEGLKVINPFMNF